jgi:Glycosyltransferase family 87
MRRIHRFALHGSLVVLLGVLCLILLLFSNPNIRPPDDFVAYWAAGRVWSAGGNPYDPDAILPIQQLANWQESVPYRVWYPPWFIPLLAPLGLMPYMLGRFLWFLLTFAALLLSSLWLWQMFGGDYRRRYAAALVALTFWPTVIGWKTGQISAFILLGVVGFLRYVELRRDLLAGTYLALACLKPHLIYLFLMATALWSVVERRWKILAAAATCLIGSVVIASAVRPSIVADFVSVALHDPPMQAVSTLGMALRLGVERATATDFYLLLWVPSLCGLVWFVTRWRGIRDGGWRRRAPILLLVSVCTAPWAWIYDQVVLLVAVMQVTLLVLNGQIPFARAGIVASYALLMAVIIWMNVHAVDAFWYFWTSLPLLAWYLSAIAAARVPQASAIVDA